MGNLPGALVGVWAVKVGQVGVSLVIVLDGRGGLFAPETPTGSSPQIAVGAGPGSVLPGCLEDIVRAREGVTYGRFWMFLRSRCPFRDPRRFIWRLGEWRGTVILVPGLADCPDSIGDGGKPIQYPLSGKESADARKRVTCPRSWT